MCNSDSEGAIVEAARAKEYYAKAVEFYEKQGMKEKADSIREELKKTEEAHADSA